jgi:hypothetical protein
MSKVVLQVVVHLASLLLGAHGFALCSADQTGLGAFSMLTAGVLILVFYLCAGRGELDHE